MNPLSITANVAKLLKHLDMLQGLQRGDAAPVLLCVAPTNRCQLSCPHCCFKDRDRSLELSFASFEAALFAFHDRGLKSVEFTGGGEPTLWRDLGRALDLCEDRGLPVGINTNGLNIAGIPWERFAWVRLNLNVLDDPHVPPEAWAEDARWIQRAAPVTACYIAGDETTLPDLERAVLAAVELEVPTRIAPDCRQGPVEIRATLARSKARLEWLEQERTTRVRQFAFVSDFNTPQTARSSDRCYIHLLKPFLWPDGWLYCCPSAELALENAADVGEAFRVCRAEDAATYYTSAEAIEPRRHACSFCKYQRQNELIEATLAETIFNEFL